MTRKEKQIVLVIITIAFTVLLSACSDLSSLKNHIIEEDIIKLIPKNDIQKKSSDITDKNKSVFIMQEDIVIHYGDSASDDFDNTILTSITKNSTDLENKETIYSIKHSFLNPVDISINNGHIKLDRNLSTSDNITIDKYGNDIGLSIKEESTNNYKGVFSKSNKFFAYIDTENNLFVSDTDKHTDVLIFIDNEIKQKSLIEILHFSNDEEDLFVSMESSNKKSIYKINLSTEELEVIDIAFDIPIKQIFQTDKGIYVVTKTDNSNFQLIEINLQTDKSSILFKTNEDISNIISNQSSTYLQLGDSIALAQLNTPKIIINNGELLSINTDDTFLIYKKKNSFEEFYTLLIYDLTKEISKSIGNDKGSTVKTIKFL